MQLTSSIIHQKFTLPVTLLSTGQVFFHLMLTTSLKGAYYFYTHFTDEKTEALRGQGNEPKAIHQRRRRGRTRIQVCLNILNRYNHIFLSPFLYTCWKCMGVFYSCNFQPRSFRFATLITLRLAGTYRDYFISWP